ncbi:MAG: hypothetical protein JST92_03185 [Deltaproteobacteria bacterium]|nr:hypothetical protein [Deltaproteobacteria bacterium]
MTTHTQHAPLLSRVARSFALALVLSLAAPRAQAADSMAEAKQHFQAGQTHYALGEFTEAVQEFREAYRLSKAPAILFNLAQAMRQIGNYKQGYFYYSQYLSQRPDAPNRAEVETFMATLKKKIEADEEAEKMRAQAEAARPNAPRYPEDHLESSVDGPAANPNAKDGKGAKVASTQGKPGAKAAPPPPPPPPDPNAVEAPRSEEEDSAPPEAVSAKAAPGVKSKGTRIAGYTLLGAGVVAGAMAFVFHSGAQSSADEFNSKYQSGTLKPSDASLRDDANSKGTLATVSVIGAGVCLVSGALLTFVF